MKRRWRRAVSAFPAWVIRYGFCAFLACLGISTPCFCSTQTGDDFNDNTAAGISTLQQFYDSTNGQWNSTGWWNAANCVEALENAVYVNNSTQYLTVISNTFVQNKSGDFLDSYYDDDGWWANAWIRAFDETGNSSYLNMAQTIFNTMTNGWDSHCGGGLWWNTARTYKNSIPNCLFMLAAIRLHQRTPGDGTGFPGDFYWATNTWAWFQNSGLINDMNLVNDGLTTNCENNGEPTWTYEQGLLVGGLTDLYKVTGSPAYLTQAEAFANAIIKWLSDANGVLTEPPPCNPVCGGGDAPQFKGCCIRYIAYLYDETNAPAYYSFLYTNAHSIWTRDRGAANRFGFVWDGPYDTNDAARQSSALMAISGVAEPVTTLLPFGKASGDPAFNHSTGMPAGTMAWACGPASAQGLMQYGPYLQSLPGGGHTAHFRIAVNALNTSSSNLASLAVTQNGATIATANVAWNSFNSAGAPPQDFPLVFTNVANDVLEFRVNWNQSPGAPVLTLSDVSIDGGHNWLAANLAHNIGRLDGANCWEADPVRDNASGFMVTGPDTAELGAGSYDAQFELKVDNFNWTNDTVATLSVVDADSGAVVASRNVVRGEFANTLFHSFGLYFQALAGAHYNFCIYWNHTPYAPRLTARSVVVTGATAPLFTPIRLASGSYNEDMVVESNAPAVPNGDYTTASMDNGTANTGNGWYAQGYNASAPATGLPPPGSTITNGASSDHIFTFAPSYTANNAAMVDASHNANLVPAIPNSFSALSFLTAAGHGPIAVDYKVQHMDGTMETGIVSSPDWFFNVPVVFDTQGRLDVGTGVFNNVNNSEPRLYLEDILLTNIVSPVTNVSLAWDPGNTTGGHAAFFALGGVTIQPVQLGVTSFGRELTLTWPLGLLLESTNINGPWVTNSSAVSPFYAAPVGTSQFYRIIVP